MQTLRWLLCGIVLATGACIAQPADEAPAASTVQDETDMPQVKTIFRSQALQLPAAETCTETDGACHVGRCELPNDTFMSITEVCCTGGTCTTEHYRLCGC
jgi:hypothetical protein